MNHKIITFAAFTLVLLAPARSKADNSQSTSAIKRYDLLCDEAIDAPERMYTWIRLNSFPTQLPRSDIELRLDKRQADGSYTYEFSKPGFMAVTRVEIGDTTVDTYKLSAINSKYEITIQSGNQVKLFESTSTEIIVHKMKCKQQPGEDLPGGTSVGGTQASQLVEFLKTIRTTLVLGNAKQACTDFSEYVTIQQKLINTKMSEWDQWEKRNMMASKERNTAVNEYCAKAITGYEPISIAQATALFDNVIVPYAWQ